MLLSGKARAMKQEEEEEEKDDEQDRLVQAQVAAPCYFAARVRYPHLILHDDVLLGVCYAMCM